MLCDHLQIDELRRLVEHLCHHRAHRLQAGLTSLVVLPTPNSVSSRAGHEYVGFVNAAVREFQVTFDCAEPARVGRFWCEVLGYVAPPDEDDDETAFACTDPTGVGPRLLFLRVPEGKVVKNRVHLDVRVGTGMVGDERLAALEAEGARLIALGAQRVRLLRADGVNESCLVMQDVEGNEFCLD